MTADLLPRTAADPDPQVIGSPEQLAVAFLAGYQGHTRSAYGRDLTDFFRWCREHQLDVLGIRRLHVDAYIDELINQRELSAGTVRRRLVTLAGLYRYAVVESLISVSPVDHVRRPRTPSGSTATGLDRLEVVALLTAAAEAGPREHALVLLLVYNGLRISELLRARAEDLDHQRGHTVLRVVRKGGRGALVPLASQACDALATHLGGRTAGLLFPSRRGGAMSRSHAWRLIRRLAATAVPDKADRLHPHDLRHTFITLALDAGVPLRDVQDAAGHADPRTTRGYDRGRHSLDRHATYTLAEYLDGAAKDSP